MKLLRLMAGVVLVLVLSGLFALTLSLITHTVLITYFALHTRNYYSELSELEKNAYRHMEPAEVEDLLRATWSEDLGAEWDYQPWIGYRESSRQSRFLNISQHGIRSNSQEAWKIESLNDAVWFFGGSTTFGYGVADDETIPAALESERNERVINLGRGYYYSAQENFLFKQLLDAGYRPASAIFLDGINERCSIDTYQAEMAVFFEQAQYHYRLDISEVFRPILFVADQVLRSMKAPPERGLHRLECESYGRIQPLEDVLRTNLEDRAALCSRYEVDCFTFAQPFAGMHGIHEDFDRFPEARRLRMREKFAHLEPVWREAGAHFLDESLDDFQEHAYVDEVHYSAAANRQIAKVISADGP